MTKNHGTRKNICLPNKEEIRIFSFLEVAYSESHISLLFTIKYVLILRMTLTGIRCVTVENVFDDTVPLNHVAWLRDPISSVFCNIPSLSNLRKHQTRNISYCSSLQVDKTKSSTKQHLKVESNTYKTLSHVKCWPHLNGIYNYIYLCIKTFCQWTTKCLHQSNH